MLNNEFISEFFQRLPDGSEVASGLTNAEVAAIEERNEFRFPPDLVYVLQHGVPAGSKFYDWRSTERLPVKLALDWATEGILVRVAHGEFWYPDWGSKPDDSAEAAAIATDAIAAAPRLIPIYSHRFMPETPPEAGNPVFSVWDTDIIVYGFDLEDYLRHEFFKMPYSSRPAGLKPRWIDLWSGITRMNQSWSDDWPQPT